MISHFIFRLLAGGALIFAYTLPLPARESNESTPAAVHQVLAAKPKTMMLDYFSALAADRPRKQPLPMTKAEWVKRRAELRRQLWQSLGNFPQNKRPPLNARIIGTIDHGVEKILYESLPGLYVTALAYIPKKIEGRPPAAEHSWRCCRLPLTSGFRASVPKSCSRRGCSKMNSSRSAWPT